MAEWGREWARRGQCRGAGEVDICNTPNNNDVKKRGEIWSKKNVQEIKFVFVKYSFLIWRFGIFVSTFFIHDIFYKLKTNSPLPYICF